MNCHYLKPAVSNMLQIRGLVFAASSACLLILAGASAQQPAPSELTARAAAASAARDTQDPTQIAQANQRLLASAFKEIGDLRLIESALTQAVDAYTTALKFEDTPAGKLNLQIDIATAELQANQLDAALKLAEQAHAADPSNIKADRVLASGYVQKGEYLKAIEPFTIIAKTNPAVENLYPLAVCLLETHRPEDKQRATQVFDQMRQASGDSGSLHVLIGRAYRDADDMPSAVAAFQRAIAIDPRTPHAHYFLGLARLFMNDWKPTPEAEAELRKEAEYFPHDYLANYMLGFLTSGERNYAESDKYLQAASEIDPTAPEPFLYLGLNAYAQEDVKRAETMLRQAVTLTGSEEARSNYQIRRAYVDLGRILSNSNRSEEAETFLAKARDLQNKTMVQTQQSVAAIAQAGGQGSSAAVMPLSRQQEDKSTGTRSSTSAIKSKLTPEERTALDAREQALQSTLGLAFNDLATSEAVRGQFAQALTDYQQAEYWDSSLPGLEKNLGQCAFRIKDYAQAIHGLALALAQQPNSAAMRAMLGVSYYATDHYADAASTFDPLGSRGMQDSATGYAWAASLAHLGDMKRAAEVLTAFASQPRDNDTLLLIGQLWTQIGDYAHAAATLQQALASNPSLPTAHFYIGLADIHWEHWSDAAKEFQAELDITPQNPDAEYHLGFVDLQQSKTDEALTLFRQVIAAHPDYANAQYQLGKVLLDRGQVSDAIGHLEAAARLSPQTDYMHYQLQAAYRKDHRLADADRELAIYKDLKAKSRERAANQIDQIDKVDQVKSNQ